MGNLNLEVTSLKNAIEKKEKVALQEELEKEKDFQEEYKHNVKNWRK